MGPAHFQKVATGIYSTAVSRSGNSLDADINFLQTLGASSEAGQFYDAIDDSPMFRLRVGLSSLVESRCRKHSFCSVLGHQVRSFALTVFLVAFYYFDLVKDIIVAVHINDRLGNNFLSNEFALATSIVLTGSILATEISNLIVLFGSRYYSRLSLAKKVLYPALTPLMPLILCHNLNTFRLDEKLYHHEVSLCLENGNLPRVLELEGRLSRVRSKINPSLSLLKNFKANDMVVENFFQMLMILLVALTDNTRTPTVAKLGGVLLSDEFEFAIAAIGASYLSLVVGHILYVRNTKNGFLPFTAILVQLFYFGLSVGCRIFSIVVFLTPKLGLWNTMYHTHFANIPASEDRTFDYYPNGTKIYISEAWQPFQLKAFNTNGGLDVPLAVTLPLVLFIHIVTGLAIAIYFKTSPLKETQHWHVLYTLVCPPLFSDWQELYSNGIGKGSDERERSRHCWKLSWSAYLCYVALFVFESAILSWPIIMLKIFIINQKADMEAAFFPQLPEEDISERNVNVILLVYLPLFLFVLPITQIILAYAYFKHLHPWARIIKRVTIERSQ